MTFWLYIIISLIIQAIIIVERQIRLRWVHQMLKESLTNSWFWIVFFTAMMVNVIIWPVTIFTEIHLIRNEM